MTSDPTTGDGRAARFVRLALLGILLLGVIGTGVELLLLKHTEDYWQLLPIALLGLSLVFVAVVAYSPEPATIRAFQALMIIFILSGAVGTLLHYRGNAEWELERMASLSGFELFRHAMMGATPALAPGTMIQLGLIGLLYTYRHPALNRRPSKAHSPGTST